MTTTTELNIFVRTPDGFDAHVKVAGIESGVAAETLSTISGRLKEKGFQPSSRYAPAATAATSDAVKDAVPSCRFCNGAMWDNRKTKRSDKAPDYKCKDKDSCGGAAWVNKDGSLHWRTG